MKDKKNELENLGLIPSRVMRRLTPRDQVCKHELAMKLKELGVEQKSIWYWLPCPALSNRKYDEVFAIGGERNTEIESELKRHKDGHKTYVCSAFTLAELGEMLPPGVCSGKTSDLEGEGYTCKFHPHDGFGNELQKKHLEYTAGYCHENEADARAQMLIWMIENQMAKRKEC